MFIAAQFSTSRLTISHPIIAPANPALALPTLQFVQCLANPRYLTHLAASKYLADPAFVAYLKYLLYWTRPPYLKYLSYPGPTLKALRLLQNDRFRRDILHPDLAQRFVDEALRASVEWHREEEPVVVAPAQPAGGTGSAGSAGGDGKGG